MRIGAALLSRVLGNLTDRLHGFVVDFIDVILPWYGHWPAFNIAIRASASPRGRSFWRYSFLKKALFDSTYQIRRPWEFPGDFLVGHELKVSAATKVAQQRPGAARRGKVGSAPGHSGGSKIAHRQRDLPAVEKVARAHFKWHLECHPDFDRFDEQGFRFHMATLIHLQPHRNVLRCGQAAVQCSTIGPRMTANSRSAAGVVQPVPAYQE